MKRIPPLSPPATTLRALALITTLLVSTTSALGASCVHPAGGVPMPLLGDLNASGATNVADAVCAILATLAEQAGDPLTGLSCLSAPLQADVTCDVDVDVTDTLLVINLSLGIDTPSGLNPDAGGCPGACEDCTAGGGSCLIGGAGGTCVAEGFRTGVDGCQVCSPADNTTAYTADTCTTYYLDSDSDGAGVDGDTTCACVATAPYTAVVGGDCDDGNPGLITNCGTLDGTYLNCTHALAEGNTTSGVYNVDPDGPGGNSGFDAYCDMTTDGGGWMAVMNTTGPGQPFGHVIASTDAGDVTSLAGDFRVAFDRMGDFEELRFRCQDASGDIGDKKIPIGPTAYADLALLVDVNMPLSQRILLGTSERLETNTLWTSDYDEYFFQYNLETSIAPDGAPGGFWSPSSFGDTFAECNNTFNANDHSGEQFSMWVRGTAPYRDCYAARLAGVTVSGTYLIDPDGSGGAEPVVAYCDMMTDGGGWTLFYAATGADGEEPMVSDVPVGGDPSAFEHYNLTRAQKMALSLNATETIFVRDDGTWLRAGTAAFDQLLDTPDTQSEFPTTVQANDGTAGTAILGYANYQFAGGGDYGIALIDFDNHASNYRMLNSSCVQMHLYSYSNDPNEGDAGYDVNTGLGSWAATASCDSAEGGSLAFYAAMRHRPVYRDCLDAQQQGETQSGQYRIDPDGESMGAAPFTAYCDMTTDGGGWTVFYASTGADNEVPMVSNAPVIGDPLNGQAFNTTRAAKMALSAASNETLFVRSDGRWLRAHHAAFDELLDTATTQSEFPTSLQANDGTTGTGILGYANYAFPGGGDYGIAVSNFDNHSNTYRMLNAGCGAMYLYSYSFAGATPSDSDAGYDVNTALGTWTATHGCHQDEGATIGMYVAMRQRDTYADCADARQQGETQSGLYTIDPDGSTGPTAPFEAYCDFDTAPGGWTLVGRYINSPTNSGDMAVPGAVNTLADPDQMGHAKLSDAAWNALRVSAGAEARLRVLDSADSAYLYFDISNGTPLVNGTQGNAYPSSLNLNGPYTQRTDGCNPSYTNWTAYEPGVVFLCHHGGLGGGSYDYGGLYIGAPALAGTVWIGPRCIDDCVPEITATGGTVTEFTGDGTNGDAGVDYRVHTFTGVGSHSFDATSVGAGATVEYLIVAGGGGGGGRHGGGGGAGGLLTNVDSTPLSITATTYTVVVGDGGAGTGGGNGAPGGANGQNSSFAGFSAVGGGGGGAHDGVSPGKNGGSGGGGASHGRGLGTAGQGNNGGTGVANQWNHGGGGGAGAPGQNGTGSTQGDGGVGLELAIDGTAKYYAGGGGGGGHNPAASKRGFGGLGGGGDSGAPGTNQAGAHGVDGTGGGGGGGATTSSSGGAGGTGGSGVVIIRYPIP